jgi:hypothetical protein
LELNNEWEEQEGEEKKNAESSLLLFKFAQSKQALIKRKSQRETLIKMDLAFFWDLISATGQLFNLVNTHTRIFFFGFFKRGKQMVYWRRAKVYTV